MTDSIIINTISVLLALLFLLTPERLSVALLIVGTLFFWAGYVIGKVVGRTRLWKTLAKTPRHSLRDLL